MSQPVQKKPPLGLPSNTNQISPGNLFKVGGALALALSQGVGAAPVPTSSSTALALRGNGALKLISPRDMRTSSTDALAHAAMRRAGSPSAPFFAPLQEEQKLSFSTSVDATDGVEVVAAGSNKLHFTSNGLKVSGAKTSNGIDSNLAEIGNFGSINHFKPQAAINSNGVCALITVGELSGGRVSCTLVNPATGAPTTSPNYIWLMSGAVVADVTIHGDNTKFAAFAVTINGYEAHAIKADGTADGSEVEIAVVGGVPENTSTVRKHDEARFSGGWLTAIETTTSQIKFTRLNSSFGTVAGALSSMTLSGSKPSLAETPDGGVKVTYVNTSGNLKTFKVSSAGAVGPETELFQGVSAQAKIAMGTSGDGYYLIKDQSNVWHGQQFTSSMAKIGDAFALTDFGSDVAGVMVGNNLEVTGNNASNKLITKTYNPNSPFQLTPPGTTSADPISVSVNEGYVLRAADLMNGTPISASDSDGNIQMILCAPGGAALDTLPGITAGPGAGEFTVTAAAGTQGDTIPYEVRVSSTNPVTGDVTEIDTLSGLLNVENLPPQVINPLPMSYNRTTGGSLSINTNVFDATKGNLQKTVEFVTTSGSPTTAFLTNSGGGIYTGTVPAQNHGSFIVRVTGRYTDANPPVDMIHETTVNLTNLAPVVDQSLYQVTVGTGGFVGQRAVTDGNSDSLTFSVNTPPEGVTINPTTGQWTVTPPGSATTGQKVNFTVDIDDGFGGITSYPVEATYNLATGGTVPTPAVMSPDYKIPVGDNVVVNLVGNTDGSFFNNFNIETNTLAVTDGNGDPINQLAYPHSYNATTGELTIRSAISDANSLTVKMTPTNGQGVGTAQEIDLNFASRAEFKPNPSPLGSLSYETEVKQELRQQLPSNICALPQDPNPTTRLLTASGSMDINVDVTIVDPETNEPVDNSWLTVARDGTGQSSVSITGTPQNNKQAGELIVRYSCRNEYGVEENDIPVTATKIPSSGQSIGAQVGEWFGYAIASAVFGTYAKRNIDEQHRTQKSWTKGVIYGVGGLPYFFIRDLSRGAVATYQYAKGKLCSSEPEQKDIPMRRKNGGQDEV